MNRSSRKWIRCGLPRTRDQSASWRRRRTACCCGVAIFRAGRSRGWLPITPPIQFVIDRDDAKESLFKNVSSPVPADQRLIAAKGMLADHPLEKAELLRYTYSGGPKGGGNHGHQRSEADEVGPGNRDRQHEKDFGVHETPERESAENSPAPPEGSARTIRPRVN